MKIIKNIVEELKDKYFYKVNTINNIDILKDVNKTLLPYIELLNNSIYKDYVWFDNKYIYIHHYKIDDIKQYLIDNNVNVLSCADIKCSQKVAFKIKTDVGNLISIIITGGKKKVISLDNNNKIVTKNESVTNFTYLYESIIVLSLEKLFKHTTSNELEQNIIKFNKVKGNIVFTYLNSFIDDIYNYLLKYNINFTSYKFELFNSKNILYKNYKKLGGTYQKDNWNPADILIASYTVLDELGNLKNFSSLENYISVLNSYINDNKIIPISLKFNTEINNKEKHFNAHIFNMKTEISHFEQNYKVIKFNTNNINKYYINDYINKTKIFKNIIYGYEIQKYNTNEKLQLRLGNRSDSTYNNNLITFETIPAGGHFKLGSINKDILNNLFNIKSLLTNINNIDTQNKDIFLTFMNQYVITDYIFTDADYNIIKDLPEQQIRYIMSLHSLVYLFDMALHNNPIQIIKSVFKIDDFNSNYIKIEYK